MILDIINRTVMAAIRTRCNIPLVLARMVEVDVLGILTFHDFGKTESKIFLPWIVFQLLLPDIGNYRTSNDTVYMSLV